MKHIRSAITIVAVTVGLLAMPYEVEGGVSQVRETSATNNGDCVGCDEDTWQDVGNGLWNAEVTFSEGCSMQHRWCLDCEDAEIPCSGMRFSYDDSYSEMNNFLDASGCGTYSDCLLDRGMLVSIERAAARGEAGEIAALVAGSNGKIDLEADGYLTTMSCSGMRVLLGSPLSPEFLASVRVRLSQIGTTATSPVSE